MGKKFGGQDHSTITTSVQTAQDLMKVLPEFRRDYDRCVMLMEAAIEGMTSADPGVPEEPVTGIAI